MSIYKEQSLANLQISNFTLLTSSIEGVAKIVMRERGDIYILNFSNELRIQRKFQKIYAYASLSSRKVLCYFLPG